MKIIPGKNYENSSEVKHMQSKNWFFRDYNWIMIISVIMLFAGVVLVLLWAKGLLWASGG
jgi:hypothetical protein